MLHLHRWQNNLLSQQIEDPRCRLSVRELNLLQKYLFLTDPLRIGLFYNTQSPFELRLCTCFSCLARLFVGLSLQEKEIDETNQISRIL